MYNISTQFEYIREAFLPTISKNSPQLRLHIEQSASSLSNIPSPPAFPSLKNCRCTFFFEFMPVNVFKYTWVGPHYRSCNVDWPILRPVCEPASLKPQTSRTFDPVIFRPVSQWLTCFFQLFRCNFFWSIHSTKINILTKINKLIFWLPLGRKKKG